MKKRSYLTVLAALAAGSLASGIGFAQTSSSSGVNSGSPTSSSPMSGVPNPGSARNESISPAPNTQSREPAPPATITTAPSASSGTTMNSGPDRALTTPEDRATCAALSGMTQADCIADVRKQRESRGRM